MSHFQQIPITLGDEITIPGHEDLGPVEGHFVMYLGSAGSYWDPPEDPHVEEVQVSLCRGGAQVFFHEGPVDGEASRVFIDLDEGGWASLDTALWALAEDHWNREASRREAEAEDYLDAIREEQDLALAHAPF